MIDQTIAKPLRYIRDKNIFVHGIPYIVTFIVINNNVLYYNYAILLRHPWLRNTKVSHDWKINIVTIHKINIVRTIHVTKKLGVQTKRPKVLICYDFHSGIFDDEDDVMFATKLNLFFIGTIIIPTHIEHVPTMDYTKYYHSKIGFKTTY
jgi:hypothetical protein